MLSMVMTKLTSMTTRKTMTFIWDLVSLKPCSYNWAYFFSKFIYRNSFILVHTEDENNQSNVQFKVLTTSLKILFYAWGNWAQTICCLLDPRDACQNLRACMKKQRVQRGALTAFGTGIWITTAATLDIIQINNEARVGYAMSTYCTKLHKKNGVEDFPYHSVMRLLQLRFWC